MSKVPGKKVVRRSKRRKTVTASPASLPPQVPDVDASASAPPADATNVPAVVKKPFWDVGKDSVVYERAMKILALRAAGVDDKSIADTLKLSMQTVWNYCYLAGKNGWADTFANAKDQIEFAIMPKVVREIEAGLDDRHRNEKTGLQVATTVALKVAEMTIAKKFEQATNDRPISNVIAIRIEHVGNATAIEVLDANACGRPAYAEGEVLDVGGADE